MAGPISAMEGQNRHFQISSSQDLHCLLQQRNNLTENLQFKPTDPSRYLERGRIYVRLGYPDLAAADAYFAITLVEKLVDPHDSDFGSDNESDCENAAREGSPKNPGVQDDALLAIKLGCFEVLVFSLIDCGCLQDAYRFWIQAGQEGAFEKHKELAALRDRFVSKKSDKAHKLSRVEVSELPKSGNVRREVYPWNSYEPDRTSSNAIGAMNKLLREIAPDLEVRSTYLPDLGRLSDHPSDNSLQLGLFAKRPLRPGKSILKELSVLTATSTLHAPLCDACQGCLPELSSVAPPVPCSACNDTIFCSETCHDLAQTLYHSSLCAPDSEGSLLGQIGRSGPLETRSDDLYLLLLVRVIAMSIAQHIHPLDLSCTKYLFGDFSPPPSSSPPTSISSSASLRTLPFTFTYNIALPLQMLQSLQSTTSNATFPFSASAIRNFDPWIIQTLYAKLRAVASARQGTWDGGPEVAAVHPLWCLANHSCGPNVKWNWEGSIAFRVRERGERVRWGAAAGAEEAGNGEGTEWEGIEEGEEILNHYCDISMPVRERREWAKGALGGECRCERCVWEAKHEADAEDASRN